MTTKQLIDELENILSVLKKYEEHVPPAPESESFYATYNGSIVYIYDVDRDGGASAVILKGGCDRESVGSSYYVERSGYHGQGGIGSHVLLTLLKKLDIEIPVEGIDTPS